MIDVEADEPKDIAKTSIGSLVMGFVTAPGVFCCFGFGTGIIGIILGLIGWNSNKSSNNRIVAGFGLGINSLSMLVYVALFGFTMHDSMDPEKQAEREQEREERSAQREAEAATAKQTAREEQQAKWDALPVPQRDFCKAVQAGADAYSNANNDLKKSKTRRDRATAIKAAVPGGKVVDWTGKVKTLTTTGEGNVVLVITLPCHDFAVGTWNNELSDIGDGTLISANSNAYNTLAEMNTGDTITFSGRLISDNLNGWKGMSLTEYGSMTSEEFLLRF